jgi:hypothetical protein
LNLKVEFDEIDERTKTGQGTAKAVILNTKNLSLSE